MFPGKFNFLFISKLTFSHLFKLHILNITFMIFEFPRYIKECSSPSMELAATVMVNGATLATLLGKWPFLPEVETKFPL